MSELIKMLSELCEADGVSGLDGCLSVAEGYLGRYAKTHRSGGSLIGTLKGKSDKTLLLDAHIDQVGFTVTSLSGGFLKVAAIGGIDSRMLPGMRVTVHGKSPVGGVFCSTPPHLSGDDRPMKLDDMYIDTGLADAAEYVSLGDRVTFRGGFSALCGTKVTARSLDDRAGVAALLRCAELLKDKELPLNVTILLSDMEEIGGSGALTESFSLCPDEAVAVDVSFGNAPDIPAYESGKLGKGAMIGISPILSKSITKGLKAVAIKASLPFQFEVMGSRTATNADKITSVRGGVPTGLVSIPLRNMHTPAEVVDLNDIEATAKLLAEYILSKFSESEVGQK